MDPQHQHKELIKSFFLAFKRLSLYAAEHPLAQEILRGLLKTLEASWVQAQEILIVAGAGANEIFVNETIVESEALGVPELYEKLKALGIDGLSFIKGLTYQEMAEFIKTMAKVAAMDAGKEKVLSPLLRDGSEHIKIKKIHYERVEDGQKVVEEAAASGGSGGPGGAEAGVSIRGDIKNFLTGRAGDIGGGTQMVFDELEHDTAGLAQAIIDSAKESGDLETVIKKFVAWLSVHIVPVVLEKKREPAHFIEKIFDSFKKNEEIRMFPNAGDMMEACADDIKVSMLAEAFRSSAQNPKRALTLAAKILSDEDDQKRLMPKWRQRLEASGVSAAEADSFVQKLDAELAKDEDVSVSKKKLARLTRLAERFDEELDRRVKVATQELMVANQKLSDEKERAEGIMRHLSDGLVVVDRTGRIVMMNPAAEKLLNTETKEAVGKSLAESLKDEHLLALAKGSVDPSADPHITKEIELATKDENTKRILKASGAVVENQDGKAIGMVSVLSDITREKELDQMKAHFVSLVTHELRTPVVAVQKALELVLSKTTGGLTQDQEHFLAISRMNVERLNKLINDLLDVGQIESGRFVLRPTTFDVRTLVTDAQASLLSWARDKEIALKMELPETPLEVTADKDRLGQVIVNLVGNALKFTPTHGEVIIRAAGLERLEGVCHRPCLRVDIVDNGIGIDPKDFKRIFNKFEQVSLVAPQGVGGSGLGLSISKEIVTLHGGTMWVESEKGKGSRFIFVVPRSPA